MSPRLKPERSARPGAIVVHDAADVAASARRAKDRGVALTLLTAPDACDYAGPDVLLAMVRHGLAAVPGADAVAVIDCADAAGRAMAALRAGWKHVLFTGPADVAAKLAAIAQAHGARLLTERPDGAEPDRPGAGQRR